MSKNFNIFDILRQKGYNVNNDYLSVISLLQSIKIYIELRTIFNDDETSVYGYYGICWAKPYKSSFKTSILNSYEEVIDGIVLCLIDYIPNKK